MIIFVLPFIYMAFAAQMSHALPEVDHKALSQQQTQQAVAASQPASAPVAMQ